MPNKKYTMEQIEGYLSKGLVVHVEIRVINEFSKIEQIIYYDIGDDSTLKELQEIDFLIRRIEAGSKMYTLEIEVRRPSR